MRFQVEQIDHVELTVPDRFVAAAWYQDVLGLEVLPEYRFWADDPKGPLMIGTVNGGTKLALFEDESVGSKRTIGFHLVAFRVNGVQFLHFLDLLEGLQLHDFQSNIVSRDDLADHDRAWSIYFCDPWGHELELTTYEHDVVRERLRIGG